MRKPSFHLSGESQPIHYLHNPQNESLFFWGGGGGSLQKSNTSYLLLGLYHALVNRISIVFMLRTSQNGLHHGIVQVVNGGFFCLSRGWDCIEAIQRKRGQNGRQQYIFEVL